MPPLTKNLGLVKAIEVGTIPPTNVQMLWYDINLGQNLHKYYDLLTSSWVPLNLNSTSIIVDILYLDLLDLKNNNNLSENSTYRILDRADLGIVIKAISSNLLSVDGEGIFLNCDYQNIFGNNLGQWYSTLSGIVIGNVVQYLGIQYSSITGNVGTSPDGDIVNWFPIPKSTTTYILEVDIIKYDFNNDNIIYRADKRGNEVYKNISRFQWGNDNIKNNKDYSGSFTNINSRGSFDSIINKAFYEILIDETNTVNISYTEFGELPYITFTNCSGYINSCTINTQDSLTITGAVSYEKCIIYNNIGSSFSNTLDMSDVAIFSGNVITIPITLRFIGSFILLNNTGQVINKIIGMPKHNKVKFYVENGNAQQFQLTLIGSAVDYHLVGDDALLITIIGRPDASDYIEFETSDKLNVVTKVNNKQTSLGFVPVNKAGDTMTGALILNADPVVGLGAVTKNYADSLVIGLLDDRGNYNPSTNSNQYPTTGGSGTAGAILKGDLWSINGLGSGIENAIGGKTVTDGDVIRALTNTPGQTDTNWVITENNFGYVAENTTNKVTTITGNETSITKFPAVKAIVDYLVATYQTIITYTSFGTFLHAATNKTTPVDADEVGIWDSVSGLYEKVSLTNFKAFSKAYTDQFYVQIASNTTIYYYRQLTSNTGLDWRDYNVLVGNSPPKNRLTNFLGWNPAAFSPYDSTNQVVETTNSGTTWVVSAGSPSGITRRHIGTYGKRADGKVWFFGGEPQTPSTAKEVWTFDGTTYTLITSDWGIGFVYLAGFVLHNDIPYLIGGDSSPFGTPTQVLGVYRWNDGTSQFVQVGSLPAGNYSGCIVYSTGSSIVVCSGSKYLSTTSSEYNDKILRSDDNGATWSQIGTLPTEMKSIMGSGIKCYGKYFYLKGLDTSNTNSQGMWYTTDFLTWTETIGKPLASHGRGMTVHNTELYGAFGNTLNDCWKIEEITFPYYVSPLLYDWWVNLIVKPSKSLMVKLNTFAQYLDAADKWNKISFVNIIRLMETEEQALRPLRTTSNRIAVNNGVTIDSTGAVGGSGKYIDLNWNPYIDGQADNIYKQNDSCVGVYLFSNIAENAFDFGNGIGGAETSIVGRYTDGNMYTCINSSLEQPVATTDSLGYRAVTRTSSAGGNQIVNNTVTAYSRTSTGLHNGDFYGCAANGSALYSTKKQGAFFAGSSDLEPVMRQALMDLFA